MVEKGPVGTADHQRALPDMYEMIPPMDGQRWELGGIEVFIERVLTRRLLVRKRPAGVAGSQWGELTSVLPEHLSGHELISGPGSRRAGAEGARGEADQ